MMTTINYTVTFFSEWHTGSGLTSGSDLSALVIKDKNGLPYIPGRTLKGLLREAAEDLTDLGKIVSECDFIEKVFGLPAIKADENSIDPESDNRSKQGISFFSNAMISDDIEKVATDQKLTNFFYRSVASTAIGNSGVAQQKSLRTMETTIPCTLYAEISEFPEEFKTEIELCFKWVKRLGQNRHRGLGRCQFELVKIKEVAQ